MSKTQQIRNQMEVIKLDGGWTIDPDKEITGRMFEYCHACGEERTEGDDHPWCNDECLQALSDAWWEEYRKIQATNRELHARSKEMRNGPGKSTL